MDKVKTVSYMLIGVSVLLVVVLVVALTTKETVIGTDGKVMPIVKKNFLQKS